MENNEIYIVTKASNVCMENDFFHANMCAYKLLEDAEEFVDGIVKITENKTNPAFNGSEYGWLNPQLVVDSHSEMPLYVRLVCYEWYHPETNKKCFTKYGITKMTLM